MESSPEPWATNQTAAVRDEQQPDPFSACGLLLGVDLAGVASKLESRLRWKLFPPICSPNADASTSPAYRNPAECRDFLGRSRCHFNLRPPGPRQSKVPREEKS